MKQLSLPPYHLFRYRGKGYAFDIETNAVLAVDDPAYDGLKLQLDHAAPEEIDKHLGEVYGKDVARDVYVECQYLMENGLFRGPISTYDEEENKSYIERLTRMSTNKIELTLAEACNLRCRYCYVKENDALNNGLMPWEIARQAVDFVFNRAAHSDSVHITFFGGEPLLNKPVMRQVIQYSQQLGKAEYKTVSYSMTTNATLLDDEIINLIKRYNFGLMISLDGPQDIQDHMRPFADGRGSYEIATRNIKKLMRRRRAVTVRCTLSNQNLDRLRIVQFLEDFGFSRVAVSRCTGTVEHRGPYDIGPEENAVLKRQDDYLLDRLLMQLDKGEEIRFNPWSTALQYIHNKQNRRMRCGVGRGCTTAGIDGKLYPCHRYVGMENYVLGDVNNGIDRQKFGHYLLSYFQTKQKCESCWAINICGGYCPWYVSNQDGTHSPPQEWWCEEVRNWLEQGIWLYDTLRGQYPEYFRRVVGDEPVEPILR